jgi:hypothetical protein
VAVRYAARVKMITNDAAKASESKEIQRLKVGCIVACVVNVDPVTFVYCVLLAASTAVCGCSSDV